MHYNKEMLNMVNKLQMFQYFSNDEKKTFAEEISNAVVHYDVGEIIIHEGAEHGALYLLLQGSVLITKSGYDNIVAQLSAGDIFGEMSFFTKKPRFSNVIASDEVLAVKMDEAFLGQVKPMIRDKIKNYLIEILMKRLDEMNAALVKISRS